MSTADEIRSRAERLAPWVNDFVHDGVRYARGSGRGYPLGQPPAARAAAFYAAFPDALRILELGSLEAADTVALAARPGVSVLAVEGRIENLRRAQLVVDVHGAGNVELCHADLEALDLAQLGTFDAVLCAGLLYHVREPWTLLANIAAVTSGLYLSTHYWGSSAGLLPAGGYLTKPVREEHPEPQARGLSVDVRWLDRASLFAALGDAGFTDVDVLHERRTDEVSDIVVVCRTRPARERRNS